MTRLRDHDGAARADPARRGARARARAGAVGLGAALRLAVAALLALALVIASTQAEAVKRVAPPSPVRWAGVEDIGGYVELGFLAEHQERDRDLGGGSSDYERYQFLERVHIDLDAFFYHPRLISFDGTFDVGSTQDVNGGEVDFLIASDARFDILPHHPYGGVLFAQVTRSEVPRRFASSYDINTWVAGATFRFDPGPLPFRVTYQHRERSGGLTSGSIDEKANDVIFESTYGGETSRGTLDYLFTQEESRGIDQRRQQINFTNQSVFGETENKRLHTNLFLREQDYSFQSYTITDMTRFDWFHSRTLSSEYRVDFSWDRSDLQTITTVKPSVALVHQLFGSLRSRGELYARLRPASFGDRWEYGAVLDEEYSKRLGDWGHLTLNFVPRISYIRNRPEDALALVTDEPHVLVLGVPVALANPEVNTFSIRVTNDTNTVEYLQGIDYAVQTFGGLTEIRSLIGGSIADGETVLVDYSYGTGLRNDLLQYGFAMRSDVSFLEHYLVFGVWDKYERELLDGLESPLATNEYDLLRVGAQATWPWMTASAEFADYDADIGPYRSYTGRLLFSTWDTRGWNARVSGSYTHRVTKDDDRTVDRVMGYARFSSRVLRRGWWELDLEYLRERWKNWPGGNNDVDAVSLRTNFRWWYGRIVLELDGRVVRRLRDAEDAFGYRAGLRVRRLF
jgi:hypothetical protein